MKIRIILSALIVMTSAGLAEPPRSGEPAEHSPVVQDFKLRVTFHGAGAATTGVAELVIRNGVGYQFLSDPKSPVSIIDWNQGTITLLDLDRRIKTVVTAKQLDQFLGELYEEADRIVSMEEKSKSRSDRVSAEITRPLIDPNFEETYDDKAHSLTLKNRSVSIEMKGAAETDEARREAYSSCLIAVTGLGSMRDPDLLPPFTHLEAYKTLMLKHKLRPVEVTIVYRLTGPPKKLRIDYELISKLSEREIEAIARINKLNAIARAVSLNQFDGAGE